MTAFEYLTSLTDAKKDFMKSFTVGETKIYPLDGTNRVHIAGLKEFCKVLHKDYIKEDWNGNNMCHTNYDKIYFEYDGIVFFELIDKEDE